ncbi:Uncharacterised protein g7472 [Pycnogonum litorale]
MKSTDSVLDVMSILRRCAVLFALLALMSVDGVVKSVSAAVNGNSTNEGVNAGVNNGTEVSSNVTTQTSVAVTNQTVTDYTINVEKKKPAGMDWSGSSKPAVTNVTWLDRYYMQSLLLPVVCGVGGAIAIVIIVCCVRCVRRRRRRRRNVTKKLASPVMHTKQHDRLLLLGESSDEEF